MSVASAPGKLRARVLYRAVYLLPTLLIVALDVALRRTKVFALSGSELAIYTFSVCLSLGAWGGLLGAACERSGLRRHIAHFSLLWLAVLAIGAQLYTFGRYHVYLNHRAVLVGTSMLPSIGEQLWSDKFGFLRALGPPLVLAFALPLVLRRTLWTERPEAGRMLDVSVVCLLLTALMSPHYGTDQGKTPDHLYIAAIGQLGKARWAHNESVLRVHPGARNPEPLKPLIAKPARQRNVLFVLNESVRAKSSCTAFTEPCAFTPFSNLAAPNRIPLMQMRTVDSTTAISLLVMWGGLDADTGREDAHRAPLLWEYGAAAGMDTAYWTSQNMMFANSGIWLANVRWTRSVHAAQLEDSPPMETGADDGALVDRVLRDLPTLRPPFIGVVHLSNTHFPYRIDKADAPFQPESQDPSARREIENRYLDAIYHQDRAIARLLIGVREKAPDTIVFYTSDHGEQMFEKGTHSHTSTLFEPEIHVPAWFDAPEHTLSIEERATLAQLRNKPLLAVDILPTLLDIVGLWEPSHATPFRKQIHGESLLRGGSNGSTPTPMSNCNGLWACAFRNWGAMAGSYKLIATQADLGWLCFNVEMDPLEEHPLPLTQCQTLLPTAEKAGRPFQ